MSTNNVITVNNVMAEDLPFTNRELREKWNDIEKTIAQVLTQVQKTNGRVSSLENWRSFMIGGMTVLSIVVVPLLAWALYVLVNVQGQVQDAVDSALSAYDIN